MKKKIVVWGTGNVGRPAIRAVVSHRDLELVGVVVSSADKIGVDAGALAGIERLGVLATDNWAEAIIDIDCLVYSVNADTRAEDAFMELIGVLASGVNVVSTSFYPLLYPPCGAREAVDAIQGVCRRAKSSVFVSGIDPGWAMDVLPVFATGAVSNIEQIRMQEIFNYALYDQPQVVREVIGFGGPMDKLPRMLEETALRTVWEPMVRIVADSLAVALDTVEIWHERRPLEHSVEVPGMGHFEAGGLGAFRFELRGMIDGAERIVLEHITRIDDNCAPDWAYPPQGRGCHQLIIKGSPELHLTLHGKDPIEPGAAGGGNTIAANRIVNAIPAVCDAAAGILSPLDLPVITGARQWRA